MSITPRADDGHLPQRSKQPRGQLLPFEKPATSIPTLLRKLAASSNQVAQTTTSSGLSTKPTTCPTLLRRPTTSSIWIAKPTTSSTLSTKSTTSTTFLTKPTATTSAISTKPSPNSNLFTKVTANSTSLTRSPSSLLRTTNIPVRRSDNRLLSGSLGTSSSELSLTKRQPKVLVPVRSNSTGDTGLAKFHERSANNYDGRGIGLLPENEANISIDQLLAQWVEKIDKAEREFEEEELAFEKSQARLSTPKPKSLRSLSPSASTKLLDKARRIIGVQTKDRLSPITRHHQYP